MDTSYLKLRYKYSGTVFYGILPEEIELYIFKIIWLMKMNEFNKNYMKLLTNLKDLNIPLTENCTIDEALDLYETSPSLYLLQNNLTYIHTKNITSPYKWWNTRIPLQYIYRQIYFISEQTVNFNNNWYYQEEYNISVPRFYYHYIQKHYMEIIDYTNSIQHTQFIKRYNNIPITDEDWANRGINNIQHSLFPDNLKKKKVIFHFSIEEDYPHQCNNICYFC